MWSHPMSAFTSSTPSERTMDEHSSKWRYLDLVSDNNNNIEWQRRSKKWRSCGLWHVGRLCLACATATAHGASWAENNVDLARGSLEREKSCLFRRVGGVQRKHGYRFVCLRRKAEVFFGFGDVEKCVKQASVTSIEAMRPSGCRGVQKWRPMRSKAAPALTAW
eukprot:scaffold28105_cov139-Isochrysis_galbana.AAC.1